MKQQDQIAIDICQAAGIVNGSLDGIIVYFGVKQMYERTSTYSSTRVPAGRFQINVSVPGERRDRIFRTKVKDGSYDMAAVVGALRDQARIRKSKQDREAARRSNQNAAELIRNDPALKLNNTYVSGYASSANSFVAPAPVEGKISVQINFGAVDPETAVKILAFAKSLEA